MREKIKIAIYEALKDLDFVKALWIGGSEAFNRTDNYSDIDIRLISVSKHNAEIFTATENALNKIDKIIDTYTPIDPTLRGHAQRFYSLEGASPFNIIDFVIVANDKVEQFLDSQRFGIPIVLFDRTGKIKPNETANKDIVDEFAARAIDLQHQFRLLSRILVERAILRNRFAEAAYYYHARVLAPLVEILRAKYCPARQDFGPRYLSWDLPKEICAIIDKLYAVASFEELKARLDQAEELFWITVETLPLTYQIRI